MADAPLALLSEIESACRGACDFTDAGGQGGLCVDPASIRLAVETLRRARYFIEDISPVDVEEGLLVVYHFDSFDKPGRVTLRALVPHERPELDSIASIFQGAEWHEREAMEMYGLVFHGNPNPVPLLLPDDMTLRPLLREPGERLPLRKVLPFCSREGEESAESAAPPESAVKSSAPATTGEAGGKGETPGASGKAVGKAAGKAAGEPSEQTPAEPGAGKPEEPSA